MSPIISSLVETLEPPLFKSTKVSREARFDTGQWKTLATGAPALMSAVVAFDCHISEVKAVASHDIIFGIVQAVHSGPPGEALVYHDRLYKKV